MYESITDTVYTVMLSVNHQKLNLIRLTKVIKNISLSYIALFIGLYQRIFVYYHNIVVMHNCHLLHISFSS